MADSQTINRNLLFGMLALQMDFVSRQQLLEALRLWLPDKSRSLSQVLVELGALPATSVSIMDAVVDEHIKDHKDDPAGGLAALGGLVNSLEAPLNELGDAELSVCVASSQASISPSLLQRVKARDEDAWNRLTQLYGPIVKQWCRRERLTDEDADDVTQEVFRGMLKNIESFRRAKKGDTFRGWLWTITRNKIADFWRKKEAAIQSPGGTNFKMQLDQVADNAQNDSAPPTTTSERAGLTHRALAMIKVEFRESSWRAFWLTAIDGRTAAEVAEELGMKVGAVYTAKSRVLSRLREEFVGLEEHLLR